MTDKVPEWAERAADHISDMANISIKTVREVILREFRSSKDARMVERYPEMVKALRTLQGALPKGSNGWNVAAAALAGEPEEGA